MRRVLVAIALVLSTPGVALAQASVVGDWEGVLKAGAVELRLALHVVKEDDGGFKATMDNIDQGGFHIPVTSIVLAGQQLTLRIDALSASYEGTVSADATAIDGTWSQRATVPLVLARAPKRADVTPSDIDGIWTGTLDAGATKLRPLFHITNSPYGLVATMDVPEQGVRRLVATASRSGPSLKLHVKQINGTFEGRIDEARTTIDGTWSQSGASLPLVLTVVKDAAALEPRRPQNPVKPYPYREEDVAYENIAAGITLAATLTIPPGPGPFPAVVLITGSGAQDRDSSLMGHRPFLVLADYLTRRGIAVLRADDRGVGKSGGNFGAATTADFATDAEAGVAYLRTRHEVDARKIGLVGHSEGGVIAPMVAARNPAVAFIVMMAGSGVPGDEIIIAQTTLLAQAAGLGAEQVERNGALERDILQLVKKEKDPTVLAARLREMLPSRIPPEAMEMQVKALSSPWYRYFLAYDPVPALKRLTCPVLAINGERDLQVPPKQNLPAIRSALEASGNKHFEIVELPGLNHLFQTAKTGSPSEYAQIEETMSPVALDTIARWILKQ
jgi:pimeloyl-ACP methyl ester carboxylesterase